MIVESAFGQIKAGRGIRDFLLRGARKVSAEWALITATHNRRKLYTVAPGSFRGAGTVFAGG